MNRAADAVMSSPENQKVFLVNSSNRDKITSFNENAQLDYGDRPEINYVFPRQGVGRASTLP